MSRPQHAAPAPRRPAPQTLPASGDRVGDFILWDDELSGLGLRHRFGRQTWIVQARIGGTSVRRSLGAAPTLTREAARRAAAAILETLRAERASATCPATTIASFAERWLADCAGQWKARTHRAHTRGVRNHILPRLGARPVAAITAEEVADWFAALPCAPGTSTRLLAVLSGMMRHAELTGLRPPGTNPCAGMRRKASGFTATVLRAKDYARLGRALDARADTAPMLTALIRFLALTGCRRGEALALRWDWIDGTRAALPDAKAGPRSIWLGTPALELLASLHRTSDLVFCENDKPLRASALDKLWREIRTELRLGDLRLHDLRHSFATTAVSAGEPLRTVGGLLGHSDLAITEGYTHLADDTLRKAAESVGAFLSATLEGKERTVAPPAKPAAAQRRQRAPQPSAGSTRTGMPAALVQGFARSRLLLPAYCAAHGLDPVLFRRALTAENKRRERRAGK
ncbi:hypothetical protein C5F48_21090 [Cereibacter changlensis JA139]|uniref:Integrase n=1 Tax=Cereibacter changlensis JA139 TaxID=1188249 RepID=A0A2T4JPE2_9RHOB|nr:hypothetical protein C5F48_21090 [Cereibacter changlensis JA139]